MSFINTCSKCATSLRVPDDADGKIIRCSNCRSEFVAECRFSEREFYLQYGMTKERSWVGQIVGLFFDVCDDWDTNTIGEWTIYLASRELHDIGIRSSNRSLLADGIPHCRLDQCKDFELLNYAVSVGLYPDMIVQSMAFEICKIIEPDWKELIEKKWD